MATAVELQTPPLHNGDKLTREEFLRRWEANPDIKNAELIGGVVFMSSPVSVEHGDKDADLGTWLGIYKAATPGTASGHNTTSFLGDETPQPDLNLRILTERGGGSWVEGKFLHGIPELLAEISASTAAYDLHVKLELYEAAKVPEYLAIVLFEREIRWHTLVDRSYQPLPPGPDGVWRSRVFPGLWLDGQAFLKGDMPRVLAKLQDGLNSPEHQAFAADLSRRENKQNGSLPRAANA
jgi:Uma2 family endonuclease